jgi:hypothetical protein
MIASAPLESGLTVTLLRHEAALAELREEWLERLSRGCSGSGSARRTYPVGAASRAAPSAATATGKAL